MLTEKTELKRVIAYNLSTLLLQAGYDPAQIVRASAEEIRSWLQAIDSYQDLHIETYPREGIQVWGSILTWN